MKMSKPPTQSYVLWFTQRVGSTLLAQSLEDAGIVGRPREWLNAGTLDEVMKKHRATTARDLRDELWAKATTPNGVLGIKYGMVETLHEELLGLMASIEPQAVRRSQDAWGAFFPNCSHCLLTRRDKVRLAVSWWRAIKTNEWHRPRRSATTSVGAVEIEPTPDLIEEYDYLAIAHLLRECAEREDAINRQLNEWRITPFIVVYEDLVESYEETVRAVLQFLQVPNMGAMRIPEPAFAPLSDEINDAWYNRFLADRSIRG